MRVSQNLAELRDAWRCRQGSSCSENGPSGSSWGEMGSMGRAAHLGSAVLQNLLLSEEFGNFFSFESLTNILPVSLESGYSLKPTEMILLITSWTQMRSFHHTSRRASHSSPVPKGHHPAVLLLGKRMDASCWEGAQAARPGQREEAAPERLQLPAPCAHGLRESPREPPGACCTPGSRRLRARPAGTQRSGQLSPL